MQRSGALSPIVTHAPPKEARLPSSSAASLAEISSHSLATATTGSIGASRLQPLSPGSGSGRPGGHWLRAGEHRFRAGAQRFHAESVRSGGEAGNPLRLRVFGLSPAFPPRRSVGVFQVG